MRLQAMLGKILLVFGLSILLVVGPLGLISLNDAWGWPSWQIPAGGVIGGVLMAGAVGVWLYCLRLFSRVGQGTPFITDPPRLLVTTGLYRYSRNPIYLAHLAFLAGWILLSGRLAVLLYTGLMAALIEAAIIGWEEPELRKRFGEEYARYARTVPRWLFIPSHRV
jgi:protein-S-isoprenylcysteine O-methyltransferase Ste14